MSLKHSAARVDTMFSIAKARCRGGCTPPGMRSLTWNLRFAELRASPFPASYFSEGLAALASGGIRT